MPPAATRPPLRFIPVEQLHAHEEVVARRVQELAEVLRKEGVIRLAIVADAKTHVVLDGHHRLAALKALGCRRIPVLEVDYHSPDIRVGTWRQGERAPTKEEVLAHAREGKVFPPKSTRHYFPWKLEEQPVPLADLQR